MNVGPRTDRTSFEIRPTGAFVASEEIAPTDIDIRDYTHGCVVWVIPTALGTVTEVTIKAYSSDDGTTIPISTGSADIKSDDNISAGVFVGKAYTLKLTTADGTLVAGKPCGPFRLPQVAGILKISVTANGTGGGFSMRAQRLA